MATGTYHVPPASHGVVGWMRIALTGALCRPLEIGKENFLMGRRRVLPGEKEGRDAGKTKTIYVHDIACLLPLSTESCLRMLLCLSH